VNIITIAPRSFTLAEHSTVWTLCSDTCAADESMNSYVSVTDRGGTTDDGLRWNHADNISTLASHFTLWLKIRIVESVTGWCRVTKFDGRYNFPVGHNWQWWADDNLNIQTDSSDKERIQPLQVGTVYAVFTAPSGPASVTSLRKLCGPSHALQSVRPSVCPARLVHQVRNATESSKFELEDWFHRAWRARPGVPF